MQMQRRVMMTITRQRYSLVIRSGLLLLAALLASGLLSWNAAFADSETLSPTDAAYFTFDASTGTITDYAGDGPKEVVIPEQIEGVAVTAIGEGAFGDKDITSVVIPDSVTSIGATAFIRDKLTAVKIPEGVAQIESAVFAYNELTEVEIPDSVTSIDESAFTRNRISSLKLPANLKTIGVTAFESNLLTELTIPYGVETIEGGAFQDNLIASLVLPATVTSLGSTAFAKNRLTELPKNWTSLGTSGSAFSRNLLTHVVIPNDLTILNRGALYGNPLRTVLIPNSITTIAADAFAGTSLTAATILNTTVTIHSRAFDNNPATMVVIGYEGSTAQTFAASKGYTFIELTDLFTFDKETGTITGYMNGGPKEVEIPPEIEGVAVTSIGANAFASKQLTNVYIPKSVTSIGMNAFAHNQIASVSIPNSVTTIAYGAFQGNKLRQVQVPDNVTRIEPLAFAENELQSVDLPRHLAYIGDSSFERNQLEKVVFPSGVESISTAAFRTNKLTSATIPERVSRISAEAFADNQIAEATILSRETVIENNALANNQVDPANLRLLGHSGSPAAAYAEDAGHEFVPLLDLSRKQPYTFSEATAGYASVTPLTITVTKFVYGEIHHVRAALSGTGATAFELGGLEETTLDETQEQTHFTVYPKTGLTAGTYSAIVVVEADEYGIRESFEVRFGVNSSSGNGNGAGSDTGSGEGPLAGPIANPSAAPSADPHAGPSAPPGSSSGAVIVLVNGKEEMAGTATTGKRNDQTVTTITVDQNKLDARLAAEGQGAIVMISANVESDIVIGEWNGQMIKNMENKLAVIKLQRGNATFTLPAQQVDIDALSDLIGESVSLQDIKVQIEVAVPAAETATNVENAAANGAFTLVVPPVNFTIKATCDGTTVDVSKFTAYVERTIAIPDGVDPNKITTGVVFEADGTVRHVPTLVKLIDGKYYAAINSLTNSTYALVWHPLEFRDMATHWAKDAVNDMGSRMVIEGTGDSRFNPDRDITRAEFAAIIVRGLGLKPDNGLISFPDVKTADWYSGAIRTAQAYGLLDGFDDGMFRPNDIITREQAMVIIAKAMKLTGLQAKLAAQAAEGTLHSFGDADEVGGWAKSGVADTVQAGIISGRSADSLAPKGYMTRAEVAVTMQRLLKQSGLI